MSVPERDGPPIPLSGGQLLLAPGVDGFELIQQGNLTLDLVKRAGRLGVAVPDTAPQGYGLTPADILEGLSDLADFDPSQAFDPATGAFLGLSKMPASVRRAIQSVTIETDRLGVTVVTKVKFAPRTPAYALLAKFRGMEPKTGGAELLEDLAALVREARVRAAAQRAGAA